MADKKITQLTAATSAANTDLLLIVNDPAGSPVNKKLKIGDMLGETAQTSVTSLNLRSHGGMTLNGNTVSILSNNGITTTGGLTVSTGRFAVSTSLTPANSNNVFYAWPVGTITYDGNYIYVATNSSNTGIRRAALSTF